MTDAFLKFTAQAEAEAVFAGLGIPMEDGAHTYAYARMDVCILFGTGVLHTETGNTLTDEDGNEYAEMSPADGFHVNVRYSGEEMPAELVAYAIYPASPKCVWG